MNDMVERMAKAHFEERGFALPTDATWEQIGAIRQVTLIAKMRAAIEAMREPMMKQLNAAVDATGAGAGMSWVNRSPQKLFAEAWSAMLSAALADASSDIGKEG